MLLTTSGNSIHVLQCVGKAATIVWDWNFVGDACDNVLLDRYYGQFAVGI